MNPILQMGRQTPQPPDFSALANDVRAGKVDPQKRVMEMVGNLPAAQKNLLRMALPMIGRVGRQFGASEQHIKDFEAALGKSL